MLIRHSKLFCTFNTFFYGTFWELFPRCSGLRILEPINYRLFLFKEVSFYFINPCKMTLKVFLFIGLFIAGAYFIPKFFGKLCKIEMFTAIKWSFRTKEKKPFWPLLLGAFFFYLIAFILLWMFFQTPFQLADMKKTNVGGLSGYRDIEMQAKIYNPSQKTYVGYFHSNPPLPKHSFKDVFEPVFFYKRPSVDYYQDTMLFKLSTALIEVIIGSAMLIVVYLMLFVFVKDYIKKKGLRISLGHRNISKRFRETVKLSFRSVCIFFLLIVLSIVTVNVYSVHKIKNHYKELYSSDTDKIKSEILSKVKPNDTIQGIVFRRFYTVESKSETTHRASDRGIKNVKTETNDYTLINYTIEFNSLTDIPVYLNVILPDGTKEVVELDQNFKNDLTVVPDTFKTYPFIVNSDYSVSLIQTKNQ